MKASARSETQRFLEHYRSTYEEILQGLEGGPQVLGIDTSLRSADEVAETMGQQLTRLAEAVSD